MFFISLSSTPDDTGNNHNADDINQDKPISNSKQLACFSFAAYAKNLIDHLKSLNIPILPGLTDSEFASIESAFHFSFPPDLRSILREGLPIGPHFPNWRSSSSQQLKILFNLPSLNLCKNISFNNFWVDSWGVRKLEDGKEYYLNVAKRFLDKAPILIPIYRNCYIPCTPNAAGNPVFYVDDQLVRVLSFDLPRFFQEMEFSQKGSVDFIRQPAFLSARMEEKPPNSNIIVPAWAATAARRIEFWTEVGERGRRMVAHGATAGWWNAGNLDFREVRDCLEEVFWRLRDGGWREEEVREMMMMDGGDHERGEGCGAQFDKEEENAMWHVRMLLRAGWSTEDVVYSLGDQDFDDQDISFVEGKPLLTVDFQASCSIEDHDHQVSGMNQRVKQRSLEV